MSEQVLVDKHRIQLLDNRLANQIAAGEVVERPSSVVKELMENSIDAKATLIEVEIERGGTRLIRITDNGKGIHKEDLALSLTRHATSKIKSSADLACIQSLGFRGEALASISAVSKLTLTSRRNQPLTESDASSVSTVLPESKESAWQAIAHGRDMAVEILPAASALGTRIEVADLFFNTPARQKFLRTEKTEFNHIEEVFKRHALANFSIGFILKHNHKVIKRVPACGESSQYIKRIASICGKTFAENCLAFECQYESIHLTGWLGRASFHRSESDIQYVFINGRPVKDKTLNHAIRQSYDGLLPPGRMATYVIYLQMDPAEVDVNVHPTKHEVRFGQQRLIHDLLVKSISEALADGDSLPLDRVGNSTYFNAIKNDGYEVSHKHNNNQANKHFSRTDNTSEGDFSSNKTSYAKLSRPISSIQNYNHSLGQNKNDYIGATSHNLVNSKNQINEVMSASFHADMDTLGNPSEHSQTEYSQTEDMPSKFQLVEVSPRYFITQISDQLIVIDSGILFQEYLQELLNKSIQANSKPLLFPQVLLLNTELLENPEIHEYLNNLGFVTENSQGENKVIQLLIKQVPMWLTNHSNQWIFEQLIQWFAEIKFEQKTQCLLAKEIAASFNLITKDLMKFLLQVMDNKILQGKSYRRLNDKIMQLIFDES